MLVPSELENHPSLLLLFQAKDATASLLKAKYGEFSVMLQLPHGFGVSLIDDRPQELLYLSTRGIKLAVHAKPTALSATFEVEHFQV